MTMRTLVPSYLESNHINSLRHDLCDIIYNDYKGTTFSLNAMLEEKTEALNKVYKFIKEHPELSQYKEDSKYWYPYENVDGGSNLPLYRDFYPNTDNEITFFGKSGNNKNLFDGYDYLVDPVKLQFILMCGDIGKMDCRSEIAQEIIKINKELFQVLFDTVGDTINYSNQNTLEHMTRYKQSYFEQQEEIKNNPTYKSDYKNYLLDKLRMVTDNFSFVNEAFIIVNESKLQTELPVNPEPKTTKKKI